MTSSSIQHRAEAVSAYLYQVDLLIRTGTKLERRDYLAQLRDHVAALEVADEGAATLAEILRQLGSPRELAAAFDDQQRLLLRPWQRATRAIGYHRAKLAALGVVTVFACAQLWVASFQPLVTTYGGLYDVHVTTLAGARAIEHTDSFDPNSTPTYTLGVGTYRFSDYVNLDNDSALPVTVSEPVQTLRFILAEPTTWRFVNVETDALSDFHTFRLGAHQWRVIEFSGTIRCTAWNVARNGTSYEEITSLPVHESFLTGSHTVNVATQPVELGYNANCFGS